MSLSRLLFLAMFLASMAALAACGSAGAELPPGLQQVNATALPGEPTAVPRYAVAAGYDGPLFDTHAHFDDHEYAKRLAPVMRANGVLTAVNFSGADAGQLDDDLEAIEKSLDRYPGMFVPFFHTNPQGPQDVTASRLQRVVDSTDVQFKGIGEIALYRQPWQSTSFDGPVFEELYRFAEQNDLVLMMHSREMQMGEVRNVLTQHPDLKLLLHGVTGDMLMDLPEMLTQFPNLYFTLDTSTLTFTGLRLDEFGHLRFGEPLMFTDRGKSALMDVIPAQSQQMAETALDLWLPIFEAAPEKVMWGTDVAFDWHADSDTFSALIDLSRRFIAMLPEDMRDAYAFGNAERLFGSGS